MAGKPHFPGAEWETRPAEQLGFDAAKLALAGERLAEQAGADRKYRVVVVRGGHIAAEWYHGGDAAARFGIASACKSLYSCLLGIAVEEGRLPAADARVSEYYPEMLEVPESAGPKPGRANKPEDAEITFRHCITNTSGYLKPGELPGRVFHYQSWGMNILLHALGKIYGVYDAADPEGSAGPGELIREKIRDPIGGTWRWEWGNFKLPAAAKAGIYGYHTRLLMSCRDMARVGWLWRHEGNWAGRQVVPAAWVRQATVTAPHIRERCPADQWCYGHAFWTNDCGKLWPSLPRDSYAAVGAGSQHIWISPGLDLVIAQSPGTWQEWQEHTGNDTGLIRWVVDALRES